MNERLLTAALEAAGRDWPVIPLHPNAKRPAGHPDAPSLVPGAAWVGTGTRSSGPPPTRL